MQQGSDSVFGQHIVANLLLHEAELLGYVLLRREEREVSKEGWRQCGEAQSNGRGSSPREELLPLRKITGERPSPTSQPRAIAANSLTSFSLLNLPHTYH